MEKKLLKKNTMQKYIKNQEIMPKLFTLLSFSITVGHLYRYAAYITVVTSKAVFNEE